MAPEPPTTSPGGNPGDLGRRIAERRTGLGLSRPQVAELAGMDAGYLAYLEESTWPHPSPSILLRLAGALQTTAEHLEGGGLGRAPGSDSTPGGTPALTVLDNDACLRHLGDTGIGRLVFDGDHGPVALPVNYRKLDEDFVFRTGDGSILAAVRAGGAMSLEVDHLDNALGEGWSVLLTGRCAEITDPEDLMRIDALDIHPWAGGDRHHAVRFIPEEITGRNIRREA